VHRKWKKTRWGKSDMGERTVTFLLLRGREKLLVVKLNTEEGQRQSLRSGVAREKDSENVA